MAANLIDSRSRDEYLSSLDESHTESFKLEYSYAKGPTHEQFDDFLCDWAKLIWPKALCEISKRTDINLSEIFLRCLF